MSDNLVTVQSETIKKAIFELCKMANICLDRRAYDILFDFYKSETSVKAKNALGLILKNAQTAYETQRPLCQDTGQVIVFLEIGQNVHIEGELPEKAINDAVAQAYKENFFRKSVVKDAIFDRSNTQNNSPAIIYTEIVEGSEIKIEVCIKGGGSENMSAVKLLKPADGADGIIDFVVEAVKNAGAKPCPPIMLGIGIGGTMEKAALLSKKALLQPLKTRDELVELASESEKSKLELSIFDKINDLSIGAAGFGGQFSAYGVSIITAPTHIASLPVAITINCHSSRHASATITQNKIVYKNKDLKFKEIKLNTNNTKLVSTEDFETLKSLKTGEEVLLSGTIFTARDAAHKKLVELLENKQSLPFDLKNKIIFYAGPCPAAKAEVIGPIGPTTSTRMDKYTPKMLEQGVIAMIGKGERSQATVDAIKNYNAIYFTAIGGIASLMSRHVVKSEVVAFEELGTEAIRRLEVEKLPLNVAIGDVNK